MFIEIRDFDKFHLAGIKVIHQSPMMTLFSAFIDALHETLYTEAGSTQVPADIALKIYGLDRVECCSVMSAPSSMLIHLRFFQSVLVSVNSLSAFHT